MVRFLIPQFLGVCAFVYFWNDAGSRDWFFQADGAVVNDHSLQAMPVFLSQILPVGAIGLIGAGMLAGFMSTHDTYLLCWATVLTEDVINPVCGGELTVRHRLLITRVLIAVIAVFLLVWGLWYELGQDLWDYMAVTGAIYFTGAFAVLLCGLYWNRASRAGAYVALACGLFALLGLQPVQDLVGLTAWEKAYGVEITGAHVGLVATSAGVVLMVVVSLLWPDRPTAEDTGSPE